MGWLIRILLLLLLVLFLVRAAWRLIEGIIEGASGHPRSRVPQRGARMVRDPICGTYVVQSRALTAGDGQEVAYFCSDKCRDTWRSDRRR